MNGPPRYGRERLDDGARYLEFVRDRLNPHGLTFWVNEDPLFQRKGESLQGCEVKLDRRCTETGRVSVEVEEKSHSDLPLWTPSGIRKQDNSWAYIQGNYDLILVFAKNWLIRYLEEKNPPIEESLGTIRKFYLPLEMAKRCSILAVDGQGKRIDCTWHPLAEAAEKVLGTLNIDPQS